MDFTQTAKTISSVATDSALTLARRILPRRIRQWLGTQRALRLRIPFGGVRFGNLRRATPVSQVFGFDRGHCIDRYYIENFLTRHAQDIYGRVLEVADNTYTKRFGGDRVTISDVLYVQQGNPRATLIADLSRDNPIPSDTFDCIIFTQTLQFIYNLQAAIVTLHRILKPGGVLLATFPGISQISRYDMDRWGDYWRFTTLSAQRLFADVFSPTNVDVESHGNVLAANAFLHGLVEEELRREELDYQDRDYQLLITVRAVKGKDKS
jgi:SAM-dependent methyltransferase